MDGKEVLYQLSEILGEDQVATWVDDKTSYWYLWEAAKRYVARTNCLTARQEITTVENQSNYVLKANFLKLFLTDSFNRFYIRYNNSSSGREIIWKDYEDIIHRDYAEARDHQQATLTYASTTFQDTGQDFLDWETSSGNAVYAIYVTNEDGTESYAFLGAASTTTNTDDTIAVYSTKDIDDGNTGWSLDNASGTASTYTIRKVSTSEIPSHFSIRDKQSLYSQITGNATSAGADSGGECTLTDTGGKFLTTDYVSPGDVIHNTTDTSDGVVLSITSGTALVCALFGGDNDWSYASTGDAYVIQPQGRLELILDPPPASSGDIVEVWYVEIPAPVFSDYGIYRFSQQAMEAIIDYAAGKYKYRDDQPNFAREFLANWDMKIKRDDVNLRPLLKHKGFRVSFKKR